MRPPFLKAWRWVGAFGPDVMLCVARAAVGAAHAGWWAVWDPAEGRLFERTRHSWRGVTVEPGRAAVRQRGVEIELALTPAGEPVGAGAGAPPGAISAGAPDEAPWTTKTPVFVRGEVRVGKRVLRVDAGGLLDESGGRHPRHTAWLWAAGVGRTPAGAQLTWNLVQGMNAAEQAVWVDGVAHPVAPVAFDGLAGVAGLRFTAEATRARRENLVVLASDYEQPFGRFAGELPVGGPLAAGWGVMERHKALW
ncbi:MAG TPA: DUF2804 family protein [Solirubrobacteraceae bacterium]